MSATEEKALFSQIRQRMRETLDQEWKEQGASQEELDISRRLSDLFACELAAGRTPAEIEAAWEGKSAAEILCEYSIPASMPAVGKKPGSR